MTLLLIALCAVVWVFILVSAIDRKGLAIFLVWLFIAPVASNIVTAPYSNPFFSTPRYQSQYLNAEGPKSAERPTYAEGTTTVKVTELLEPTRLLFGIFFAIFFLDAAFKQRQAPPDRVEMWMLIFSIILLIGAARSLRVALGTRVAVDSFIVPFMAYYISRRLITSEERLQKLLKVMVFMGCYIIVIAVIERLARGGFYTRLGGPFKQPISLYVVVATVFMIMLVDALHPETLLRKRPIFLRSIRRFILSLAPVVIVLTWSRGNWLGFMMNVGVLLFISRKLTRHTRKLSVLGLILILIAVITLGLQAAATQQIVAERVTERTGTVYARLGAWLIILQESLKSPIFGIGINDAKDILTTTRIRFMDSRSETSTHNSYMSLFIELGIVGLFTYLVIVVSFIWRGLKMYRSGVSLQERWYGAIIVTIMVAYLIPALFANTLYISDVSHVYVYALVGGIAGFYCRRMRGNQRYDSTANTSSSAASAALTWSM